MNREIALFSRMGPLLRADAGQREFVFGLYLIGIINALSDAASYSVLERGWRDAASGLFDLNVVVILACAVALRLRLRVGSCRLARMDVLAAVPYGMLVVVPYSRAAWLAIGLFAAYELIYKARSSEHIASASIFLALAVHGAIAPLILNVLSRPLVYIDAALVTATLSLFDAHVARVGNIVEAGNGHRLAILIACSSVRGISLGLLLWITVTRSFRPAWRISDLMGAAAVCAGIIAVNVARLAVMALGPEYYHMLHDPDGAGLVAFVIPALSFAIAIYGVRHEIFSPVLAGRPARSRGGEHLGKDRDQ